MIYETKKRSNSVKTSATSCSLNGLNGIGWAGLMCDFAEKRKLKSILVHFLFPFSHPLLTLIPDILPPSLSSVRLTEQETPVRVKMKELQGRWMCAERVCEMNECPSCPLSPSEMSCLDTKAKKQQHDDRSEWRSNCCATASHAI